MIFGIEALIDLYLKRFNFFDIKHLFQVYFIVQLPLSNILAIHFHIIGSDERVLFEYSDATRIKLSLLILLAYISFFVGLHIFERVKVKRIKFIIRPWSQARTRFVAISLFLLGYFSLLVLIMKNGGLTTFLTNREAWRTGGLSGQGFLMFPATTLLGTLAVILTIRKKNYLREGKRVFRHLILVGLCILPATLLGFRGLMLLPILQVVVAYNFAVKKINIRKIVLVGMVFMVLFTSYGIYREFGTLDQDEKVILLTERQDLIFNIFLRSRGSEIVSRVIEKIDDNHEFQYGVQPLIEAATIAVPGSLWKNKPKPVSVVFSESMFGIKGGISPTVLGELYWNWGELGVIVGMFFLGVIMMLSKKFLSMSQHSDTAILLYAQLYSTFVMVAEAISGYINGLVLYTLFIIPILFFIAPRKYRKFIT